MRVRDLMSRGVVTIGASESCAAALSRMHGAKVRHLPVLDGPGRLAGVVTNRDLRLHLFSATAFPQVGRLPVERILKAVPVSEIMSAPAVSAGPDDDLATAARVMLEDKVGSLPVVEHGRVVGILTETDLLRQIVRADQGCSPACEEIIVSFA